METTSARARRVLAIIGVTTCAILRSGSAAAETTSGDRETSRNLYSEGTKALDAADYRGAEKACRGAYRLVPLPTPAVCLARALAGQAKLVEARDVYLAAARTAAKDGEPAIISEARETARVEAEKLAPRIPTLVLIVSGASGDAQLHGSVDGEDMVPETIRLPRRVNPGKHVLLIGGDSFADERVEIEIAEGEKKRVPIALHAKASSSDIPTSGWIALGVGATGVIVGSIFGALAFKDKSTLDSECKTPTTCPSRAQPDLDTLRAHTLLSSVAFVVGAVGIGTGIVLWRVGGEDSKRPAENPKTDAAVTIGPGWIGVRGAFR